MKFFSTAEPMISERPMSRSLRGFTHEVQHRAFARQPNCKVNVIANSGNAFGILLAAVGAFRPLGAPAPVI